MILSYPIDIAVGELYVNVLILSDSSYYTDKMLSVYTIRMEPIMTDFIHL